MRPNVRVFPDSTSRKRARRPVNATDGRFSGMDMWVNAHTGSTVVPFTRSITKLVRQS